MRIPAVAVATFVLAVAPFAAAAQFTAAVVPPNAMLIDSTPSESLAPREANARGAIEMRTGPLHIDSSLGAIETTIANHVSDSVNATGRTGVAASLARSAVRPSDSDPDGDTIFRDGASAPETESPLALLALAGAGTLLIGVALFRR